MNLLKSIFFDVSIAFMRVLVPGCVLSVLWNWYVASFLGLPTMSIAIGMGVFVIVRIFDVSWPVVDFRRSIFINSYEMSQLGEVFFSKYVLSPLALLLMGYIIHLFM